MRLLDRFLKKYVEKDSDDYVLARNFSIVLVGIWILVLFLSFLFLINPNISVEVLYILLLTTLSLVFIFFEKIKVAIPFTLIGISILATLLVLDGNSIFGVYEVYKMAFFQLIILGIAGLITNQQFYAYLIAGLGTISIVLQFVFRGLKIDRELVLANFEDYIAAVALILISGFIFGKVITQKKRTISELKENEDKYSTVVNNGSEGILIHQAGIIRFVNDASSELLGVDAGDLIDRSLLDFITVNQRVMIQERVDAGVAGEKIPELLEYEMVHKSGVLLSVESKRTDIIFQGEKSVLLFLRDITERKRLQETLVQSEKMLSLGGLAAGMAHEINNPLAGILQNAQVISNRLETDSPANIKAADDIGLDLSKMRLFLTERKIFRQLSRIRESGSRAAEIVANMLSFARKEQTKSSHDVRALLDKTVKMAESDYSLRKNYDFRDIEIVREYEENLPLTICDPGQLQQVFFNILKNGAEAMQDSREGLVARFKLIIKMHGENVRIEIENNLCGIPEDIQRKIFDPFYTTKPVGVGTGLGLSVSYFIIREVHNGDIWVESDGHSSVKFIIELNNRSGEVVEKRMA